ncbi:hypothetical protein EAG21025_42720 (plasmid) [Enterobacter asburiae]
MPSWASPGLISRGETTLHAFNVFFVESILSGNIILLSLVQLILGGRSVVRTEFSCGGGDQSINNPEVSVKPLALSLDYKH